MRVWTKSACVVLAWCSILVIVVAAAGMSQPARPAQANIRIASSTTEVTRPAAVSVAAVFVTAPRPAARYVVQPGDTLSGIAARLNVRGGWPALYAANRQVIGPDPDLIHPGAILVLPGRMALARYTVAAGDTLAAIAAALAVPGGWPALYAANRSRIGPDPDLIRPGTVLAIPRPAAPRAPGSSSGRHMPPAPPSAPAGGSHNPPPAVAPAAGMPQWLKIMLLAAGLVIGAAFLAEAALLIRRRRLAATRAVTGATAVGTAAGPPASATPRAAGLVPPPRADTPAARVTWIVVADHDPPLVVTRSIIDDTVCVLRPPGQDPAVILQVARLVLPEWLYRELAGQLGMPASWPIVVADHDRLVVTYSARDGTVCVLRPPGQHPAAILKAARLVLPEDLYEELADQLGVPADLPMGLADGGEAEAPRGRVRGGGRPRRPGSRR